MRKLNNYLNRRILLKCCPNNSFVTTGHQIESWPRRKYKFGFVFFLRKFFFKLRRSKISAWQQKANAAIPKYKSQFSQKRAKNIYSLEGMIGSAFITHNSQEDRKLYLHSGKRQLPSENRTSFFENHFCPFFYNLDAFSNVKSLRKGTDQNVCTKSGQSSHSSLSIDCTNPNLRQVHTDANYAVRWAV